MLETLKQDLEKLKQQIQMQEDLKQEDREVLQALSEDMQAHAEGRANNSHEDLAEKLEQACARFGEKHPDLSVLMLRLAQMLQNMGI